MAKWPTSQAEQDKHLNIFNYSHPVKITKEINAEVAHALLKVVPSSSKDNDLLWVGGCATSKAYYPIRQGTL